MLQLRGDVDLGEKAFGGHRGCLFLAQHFHGDAPAGLYFVGQVDVRRSAGTQHRQERVLGSQVRCQAIEKRRCHAARPLIEIAGKKARID
jgi:hypothetical protein